jgi:hypothetical protein
VVEIEERALGALEQDVVAAPERVLDEPRDVDEDRGEPFAPRQALGDERVDLEARLGAERGEEGVLLGDRPLELRPERGLVEEVLQADARARRTILVRRPDPAAGRAHLRAGETRLAGGVERPVVRQDHVGGEARPRRLVSMPRAVNESSSSISVAG